MHEFGLVEGIIEAVGIRAGDRPVARVTVRIGTLHHATQGPMEQAFEMVGSGTVVDGAALELIQVPVTNTCLACGRATTDGARLIECPACSGTQMVHAGGDELILESIEYRAPAADPAVARVG